MKNNLSEQENALMRKILDCHSFDDEECLKHQYIETIKLLYTFDGYFVPNVFTYCIYKSLFGTEDIERESIEDSKIKTVKDIETMALCNLSLGKNMLETLSLIRIMAKASTTI